MKVPLPVANLPVFDQKWIILIFYFGSCLLNYRLKLKYTISVANFWSSIPVRESGDLYSWNKTFRSAIRRYQIWYLQMDADRKGKCWNYIPWFSIHQIRSATTGTLFPPGLFIIRHRACCIHPGIKFGSKYFKKQTSWADPGIACNSHSGATFHLMSMAGHVLPFVPCPIFAKLKFD